jgi:type VI secretion system protein ImpM
VEVGFYGKLPSHGDFLRRRVSNAFVDGWDAWLQAGMAASRSVLGDRWLDVFLTSPAWRFACAPGPCGAAAVLGLMAPSVDRVGRYFPFTLVAELPPDVSVITAVLETAAFFDRAERLVVETLAADQVDFDRFDARVTDLRDELAAVCIPPRVALDRTAAAIVDDGAVGIWQIPIGSPALIGSVFEQLPSMRLSALYDPLALWWTEGSSIVAPACLITRGLPHPDRFAAFLDGSWATGWQTVSARLDESLEEPLPIGALFSFRSAAATDVGRTRQTNQDAFLERPEVGVWVVADGLGGHRDGDVASRLVCDALADFEPAQSFDATIDAARQRIQQVNEQLLRTGARSMLADRSGSTVVILLARGGSCAILWAGDSRVYRWRSGRLACLTRDHSVEEADLLTGRPTTNAITRAIGIESTVSLDLERDEVHAGDRFLLCSDGLTRIIPDAQIQHWMGQPDIRLAVQALIKATLDAGAPDNVTVLIVEAQA